MAIQLKWQLILLALLLFYWSHVEARYTRPQRIINGSKAKAQQFPYQVFFDVLNNSKWIPQCGGVIISERTVLTAAHCFEDGIDSIKLYFGAVNRKNSSETGQQRLIVHRENIFINEGYEFNQTLNDIAVINLPAEIQFDEFIQPVGLPSPNQVIDNLEGMTSGFGHTQAPKEGIGNLSDHLMYLKVRILPNKVCKPILHKYDPARFFPSSWVCIAPNKSTPCNGDSGGPLVIKNANGTNTLVGLTSFGMDTICSLKRPAVYTRVSSYLEWIQSAIY
ncbi:chymotrypsin-1-like [Drosophila novamexicana]|uniref:chymotrypsin-1-like n=1 Tax=Drosophila novamexicana TaxID=47314 RepID=UPI0011E5D4FD|nr:chymotrypsin-1-like [Drosophila novamexicana]